METLSPWLLPSISFLTQLVAQQLHVGSGDTRAQAGQSVPPDLQDTMIRNIGDPRVVEIDSGHNVMISKPEALARVLNELAGAF